MELFPNPFSRSFVYFPSKILCAWSRWRSRERVEGWPAFLKRPGVEPGPRLAALTPADKRLPSPLSPPSQATNSRASTCPAKQIDIDR